ncbi:MAG: hypothetical protein ACFCGT_11330 [Sandaracinaceae bacterium]
MTYRSDLDHLPEVDWVLTQVPRSRIGVRSNRVTALLAPGERCRRVALA